MGEGPREHRVAIVVEGQRVGGWTEYEINTSLTEPADSFKLTRPWDPTLYRLIDTDADVRILIDDVPVITGRIDERTKSSRARTMSVTGRDKVGRLVQESIRSVTQLDGLTLTAALKRLAEPWFTKITLTGARDRKIRTGKHGSKAPSVTEPIVIETKLGKGKVERGQIRWSVIEEILSAAELLAWASGDGLELVVAPPNYKQAAQFVLAHGAPGGRQSTVLDMEITDSVADRYSQITVIGSGSGSVDDYEGAVLYTGEAKNGPGIDGIGIDFNASKRLIMSERAIDSKAEADRTAAREMARRDFRAKLFTIPVALHGQAVAGGPRVLFSQNTMARVIDEDQEPTLDMGCLITGCSFRSSRGSGETTNLTLVPKGTRIVQ
jgi:prophage tail gpP-like protein